MVVLITYALTMGVSFEDSFGIQYFEADSMESQPQNAELGRL